MDTVTLSGVVMKGTSSITGMGARPWAQALAPTPKLPAAMQTRVAHPRRAPRHVSGLAPPSLHLVSGAFMARYLPPMPSNSISKCSVALGGMGPPGVPRSP